MPRSLGELLIRFGAADRGRAWGCAVVLAALLGEAVFRILDWSWLQLPVREAVVGVLAAAGFAAEAGPGTLYTVDAGSYDLTARCTYADLLCLTTPLVLRFDGLARDLRRVAAWWCAVIAVTVVRIAIANALHAHGTPWPLAHGGVDWVLRGTALLLLIRAWLVFAVARAERSPAPEPVPSRA